MVRATSRIPRPFVNMVAASRRRASNFFALPFGLIQTFIGSVGRPLEACMDRRKIFLRNEARERERCRKLLGAYNCWISQALGHFWVSHPIERSEGVGNGKFFWSLDVSISIDGGQGQSRNFVLGGKADRS